MEQNENLSIFKEYGLPMYGTIEELEYFGKIFRSVTNKISQSDNARDIIFEVWFLYDHFIRRVILKAFSLNRYENPDLDLMFELLPQSFDSCLKFLEKLVDNQREIYDRKSHPNTLFEGDGEGIQFSGWFLARLIERKPEVFKELQSEFDEYLKEAEPEYHELVNHSDHQNPNYEIVSKTWIRMCEKMDKSWFKKVAKINTCRNKAAHIYEDSALYSVLGISGDNKISILKGQMNDLIRNTL